MGRDLLRGCVWMSCSFTQHQGLLQGSLSEVPLRSYLTITLT